MDSASTHTLLHPASLQLPTVVKTTHHPLSVRYADGVSSCDSIGSAILTTNGVSTPASIMPTSCLQHQLIGLAPFANIGATGTFTNTTGTIHDTTNGILVHSAKNPHDALWDTDLSLLRPHGPPLEAAHAHLVQRFRNTQQRVNYLQYLLGHSPTSTVVRAINRSFISADQGWPVVGAAEYNSHAKDKHQIHQGHLRELKGGIRSTKPPSSIDVPVPPAFATTSASTGLIYVRPTTWHTDAKGPL